MIIEHARVNFGHVYLSNAQRHDGEECFQQRVRDMACERCLWNGQRDAAPGWPQGIWFRIWGSFDDRRGVDKAEEGHCTRRVNMFRKPQVILYLKSEKSLGYEPKPFLQN